jgi:hypothetical protein
VARRAAYAGAATGAAGGAKGTRRAGYAAGGRHKPHCTLHGRVHGHGTGVPGRTLLALRAPGAVCVESGGAAAAAHGVPAGVRARRAYHGLRGGVHTRVSGRACSAGGRAHGRRVAALGTGLAARGRARAVCAGGAELRHRPWVDAVVSRRTGEAWTGHDEAV